jgi:hypothetical protein
MKFRGGEFSIGTTGNFQPELTKETTERWGTANTWSISSGFFIGI